MNLIPELKIGLLNAWLPILFFHSEASVNFVTTPPDKVITVGLYKISRNPIYLLNGIIMIGVSIAAACWLMLIVIAVYWIIIHWIIKAEERYCLETYGFEYRAYMKKTARYFLFF